MDTRKRHHRVCVDCGVRVTSTRFAKTIDETRCRSCSLKGKRNGRWNGGQTVKHNIYVLLQCPDHPRADKDGYVNRAWLVWEKAHGRYVQPGEIVHHIDGNKTNDTIDNLQVMTLSEHSKLHNAGKRNGRYKHGKYVGRSAKYNKPKRK